MVVKIGENNITNVTIKTNYELFGDVETLLDLSCVLPLLKSIVGLFKFT